MSALLVGTFVSGKSRKPSSDGSHAEVRTGREWRPQPRCGWVPIGGGDPGLASFLGPTLGYRTQRRWRWERVGAEGV